MRCVNFMMNKNSLISFAFLNTTWKEYKKDSIDMLIPFMLYYVEENKDTINERNKAYINYPDIKDYLKSEFGINVYSNVIDIIIKRLSKQGYFIKDKKAKAYKLADKNINIEYFKTQRKSNQEHFQNVISNFLTYLDKKQIEYSEKEATNAIISYLCKYGKDVISQQEQQKSSETNENVWIERVGKYIEYLAEDENKSYYFDLIKDIAKGGMIASIIFQDDTEFKEGMKFKNTDIYFDTSLLMYILGYSGEALQDSVKEISILLKNQGANLCYFDTNLTELEGILDAYYNLYCRNELSSSYNFDYFIANDVKASDISEYKALAEPNLRKLGFEKKEFPPYDEYSKNIDYKAFDEYLSKCIKYTNSEKRKNDVDAIAAIYRLRPYDNYKYYESCNALFLTSNESLAYHVRKYFRDIEHRKGIPAIVSDTFLTGLIWMKMGGNNQALPTLKIISDALSSQILSSDFWNKVVSKVEFFYDNSEITYEDAALFLADIYTKHNINDVIDGDIDKLTQASIKEIIHRNENIKYRESIKEKEDLQNSLMQEQTEKAKIMNELIDTKIDSYMNLRFAPWKKYIFVKKYGLAIFSVFLIIISQTIYFYINEKVSGLCLVLIIFFTIMFEVIDKILAKKEKGVKLKMTQLAKKTIESYISSVDPTYCDIIIPRIIEQIKD